MTFANDLVTVHFLACTSFRNMKWFQDDHSELKLGVKSDKCAIHPWTTHSIWSEDCQSEILQKTFYHVIAKKYPPSEKYRKSFLKELMNQVESSGEVCAEEIFTLYVDLLQFCEEKTTYKSYFLPMMEIYVTLKESTNMLSNGTTGLVTWTGSMVLSEWCLTNRKLFDNKHILELGSGCGLLGLVLSKSFEMKSFTFTDVHPDVLEQLRANVHLNGLCQGKHSVKYFNWQERTPDEEKPDIILAADVVFDPLIVPDLARTIANLLCNNTSAVAFIASTIRNESTYQMFLSQLDSNKLNYFEQEQSKSSEVFFFDRKWDVRILKISMS
ncbi:protein-lysine N-methyltransferase EEF2KMT-like [Clavelina lepadiformis]|uniref:protein-lysine N-methyltransferase EEF2KMT-like n=1 Tax=Clavelina lepadiformis TaxID=159417 RepID=UPI0040431C97